MFSPDAFTRAVNENTGANQNVGSPVTATDADVTDTLSYTLGGTDAASFDIVSNSGQIRTKPGVTYDHEAKASYTVTVTASDDTATDEATVTVSVNDVNEPPLAPAAPIAVAVARTYDQIFVRWTPPDNAGRPEITGYDFQHKRFDGSWMDRREGADVTSATLTGLTHSVFYHLRIRAINDEGDGAWSDEALPSTNYLDIEVETDWPLIPAGLSAGDNFRLLFVTQDLYDAPSLRMDEYEDDLTQDHLISAPDIAQYAHTVEPVASTRHIDARVETNTTSDVAVVPTPRIPGSLQVFWTAPEDTGKPAVTGYDVRYSEEDENNWTTVRQDDAASTTPTEYRQAAGFESPVVFHYDREI